MEVQFDKFGFYKVNMDYLKFLNSKDSQVFYEDTVKYERKPHLGILIGINGMEYCIPLTSAKPRQLGWANISKHNIIVYEMVTGAELHRNDVYKKIGTTDTYKKILAVLEIRKMIPIDSSLYSYIDFSAVGDLQYQDLLEKEYRFLKPLKTTIIKKAEELYNKQKHTGIVESCYCNFNVLESAYKEYCSK